MNIQLLSDLHLEAHPHFVPEPAPGADVLVLAGDVGVKQRRELVANKLVLARGSVPAEVHVAMLGLVVRCYRALREEASRPEERPAPPRVVVAAPEEAPADPDPGADAGG